MTASVALGTGCGTANEICDLICDCQKCSDRGYDDCVIEVQSQIDVAADYDCSEDAAAYTDCLVEHFDCDDSKNTYDFGTSCADEEKDVSECVDKASKLIGSSSSEPQPGGN